MHKFDQSNRVVDALSKRASLLVNINNEVVGFDVIKDVYVEMKIWGRYELSVKSLNLALTILFKMDFFLKVISYVYISHHYANFLFESYMLED